MLHNDVHSPMAEMATLPSHSAGKSLPRSPVMEFKQGNYPKSDIFFDTINVQFHAWAFVYQLTAHLILPLFLVMANLHGQVGKGIMSYMGAFVAPLAVYLMIVAYMQINDPVACGVEWAFLIPLVYFLQHRAVIAIKYASMSQTEYRKFMDCRDPDRCQRYLYQMQLVQGWYAFNPEVVRFELPAASARIGARINEIDFKIADPASSPRALNQLRAWNAFLRGHQVIDFDSPPCRQLRRTQCGGYALSVYDLCEALLMRAANNRDSADALCHRLTNAFGALNMCIPLVMVITQHRHVAHLGGADKGWLAAFLMCSTLLNSFYAQLFYVLLFTAVSDVLRQREVMANLNRMIRLTDISMDVEVSAGLQGQGLGRGHKNGYWECEEEQQRVDFHIAEIMSIADAPYQHAPYQGAGAEFDPSEGHPSAAPAVSAAAGEDCMRADVMVQPTSLSSEAPARNPHEDTSRNIAAFINIPLYSFPAARPVINPSSAHSDPSAGPSADPRLSRNSVLGERLYRDNEFPLLPRLDLEQTHNVVAWTHARLAMQHFGDRFHFRLEMYVVASIAMLVLLMALGLASLSMAADRQATFFSPWFLQALTSVSMCIAFNLLIMQCGAEVNAVLAGHSHSLTQHTLRTHRKIEALSQAIAAASACGAKGAEGTEGAGSREVLVQRREALQEVAAKLEDMRAVVEASSELKPYKVFGFTAQSSLTVSIATTAASFYGIVFSLLLSHGKGQQLPGSGI